VNSPRRRVAVIGAGYVGLVTGVGLAGLGHTVSLVETNEERAAMLRGGRIPLHEAGLQEGFDAAVAAGALRVVARAEPDVDVALVCVGTPIDAEGRSDLGQVRSALADLAPLIEAGVPLVMRSTLPPGSTLALGEWSGARTSRLLTNPEFLRQGTALADFLHPARIVIGSFPDVEQDALDLVLGLFDGLPGARMVVSVAAAELIKNGANAFLALKLSFANELASLSEEYGADIDEVLSGIAGDPRIGSQYMRPGFGFGGSCLPKELKVLEAAGQARGLQMHITAAASSANAASQARFAARIERALGGLDGRRIALLGLAFKAETDDVRDSPALAVAARLLGGGAEVLGYDPHAAENARRSMPALRVVPSVIEAVRDTDAVVIATEWPEFAAIDWDGLRPLVRQPLVIDGRRLLRPDAIRRAGYRYLTIGSLGEAERGLGSMSEAMPAEKTVAAGP
jgi:UDPglucose 6-dehydrogenase